MYIITRETIYFINLRHAYLIAPFNASKMSSRTILFTDVPKEYQNIEKLQSLFGNTFKRSWLTTDCKELTEKVEERDKDALKLEGAEIKLTQTANKRRLKAEKKNKGKSASAPGPRDAEVALPGAEWLRQKDRPTFRPGKIPLIGKKVDTIEWSRIELKRLIPEVEIEQKSHMLFEEGKLLSAVFVEFHTQAAAEAAYRRISKWKEQEMNPRAISVAPSEIVWENLRIKPKERKMRKLVATAFIVALIIFWAIPVAVVGAISNINYLTNCQ